MLFSTLKSINQQLKEKKISAQELCQETLSHTKKDSNNSILSTCETLAIEQAKHIDSQLDTLLSKNILTGTPVIYKDNFNIKHH